MLNTPLVEVHKIHIRPHSACSLHKHNFKWNAFYVVSGVLYIEAHKANYELIDVTTIGPGELATFPPGEFHKFYTLTSPVECLEIYYPESLSEDIVRKTVGATNIKEEAISISDANRQNS